MLDRFGLTLAESRAVTNGAGCICGSAGFAGAISQTITEVCVGAQAGVVIGGATKSLSLAKHVVEAGLLCHRVSTEKAHITSTQPALRCGRLLRVK